MNFKTRIKRIETLLLAEKAKDEKYLITLDEWREYFATGEKPLSMPPERFKAWRHHADKVCRQIEQIYGDA